MLGAFVASMQPRMGTGGTSVAVGDGAGVGADVGVSVAPGFVGPGVGDEGGADVGVGVPPGSGEDVGAGLGVKVAVGPAGKGVLVGAEVGEGVGHGPIACAGPPAPLSRAQQPHHVAGSSVWPASGQGGSVGRGRHTGCPSTITSSWPGWQIRDGSWTMGPKIWQPV